MISLIVPIYNEKSISSFLKHTIESAKSDSFEIILVEGYLKKPILPKAIIFEGSAVSIKVIHTKVRNRALQQNQGACSAIGDVLLFLHSDTLLPLNWDYSLRLSLSRKKCIGGCFWKKFDSLNPLLFLNAFFTNLRALFFNVYLGDNAIFVRNSIFSNIGGFDNVPILEDVIFTKKMRAYVRQNNSQLVVVRRRVITSARRFYKYGIVSTFIRMQGVWFHYLRGDELSYVAKKYKD